MRALRSGRHPSTAITLATLLLALTVSSTIRAEASEDFRACLSRETATFYGKLATAVLGAAIDSDKIDDHFIAQATDSIVKTCGSKGADDEADVAAFKDYMAQWRGHIDRKVGEMMSLGSGD